MSAGDFVFHHEWSLPGPAEPVVAALAALLPLTVAMVLTAPVAALPGTKVLLRGNHDYWWPGLAKLRSALPPGMLAVQNDSPPGDMGVVRIDAKVLS